PTEPSRCAAAEVHPVLRGLHRSRAAERPFLPRQVDLARRRGLTRPEHRAHARPRADRRVVLARAGALDGRVDVVTALAARPRALARSRGMTLPCGCYTLEGGACAKARHLRGTSQAAGRRARRDTRR